jgi:hypothetical protein
LRYKGLILFVLILLAQSCGPKSSVATILNEARNEAATLSLEDTYPLIEKYGKLLADDERVDSKVLWNGYTSNTKMFELSIFARALELRRFKFASLDVEQVLVKDGVEGIKGRLLLQKYSDSVSIVETHNFLNKVLNSKLSNVSKLTIWKTLYRKFPELKKMKSDERIIQLLGST